MVRTSAILSVLGLVLAGCFWFDTPGLEAAGVALEEMDHPLVADVSYHHATYLGEEELTIDLRSTATEADALQLWCEVLEPLGADASKTFFFGPGIAEGWWPGDTTC